MDFLPFKQIWDRVEIARQNSDTDLFIQLMYLGEMIIKTTAAGLIATIGEDRDRHRYRQAHRIVRADGIGEWCAVIDDVLIGPAAQHLLDEAYDCQADLTKSVSAGTWQFEAVSILNAVLKIVQPDVEELPRKVSGRRWFASFATLRNKTRGHGAPPSSIYSHICPDLEISLRKFTNNFSLFTRPWAFLHRNLSGKYHVTGLAGDQKAFENLKRVNSINLVNGIYIHLGEPVLVELIHSNKDALDFYFPNGGFRDKSFELISYLTGNRIKGDATPYQKPATELPSSETHGLGSLDVQGNGFGNLPPAPSNYIQREHLESDLLNVLTNDRHPVITLLGRGGIGKTYLALSVLQKIITTNRFGAVLWFSARDIDLLPDGPKLVKPNVLKTSDIAKDFVRLLEPSGIGNKESEYLDYFAKALTKSPTGDPILFVLDNFETVINPVDVYNFIDTYIRTPNKVLITTRIRDFKGDYPVEVSGMNELESKELIDSTAGNLGIRHFLTNAYCQELIQESDGHPYVMKVLLGEVAKAGRLVKVERIVADNDGILTALFERTYSSLSPAARRVFLTLCNWRSTVPQLALEAVLLRSENEKMDAAQAIEELSRSSFIEISKSEQDESLFLSVPLVATIFGKNKLAVSPMEGEVKADTQLLHLLGADQKSGIKKGLKPRIEKLFRSVAMKIGQRKDDISTYVPMLEFIASKYYPGWLLLASLYEEYELFEEAKGALTRFLESPVEEIEQLEAWEKRLSLCQLTEDWLGELHALVKMCQLSITPFTTISNAANEFNKIVGQFDVNLGTDEKQILIRQLVEVMQNRMEDPTATDCSRLAWLYLHLRDEASAGQLTMRGLKLEPNNRYCQKLAERLGIY